MKPAGWLAIAIGVLVSGGSATAAPLPAPGFHHLELNSVDPDAAIAFYTREFPSTSRTTWEGIPALASPDGVLILFNKVASPPDSNPESTAYWHFGWNIVDSRKGMERFKTQPGLLTPFYTDDEGHFVYISSDTYPYPPGVPGRTKAQIAEARAQNLQPSGVNGNGYINGPDHTLIEFTNGKTERFDHVHMWQENPLCAQLWYETHLNAPGRAARGPAAATPITEANCKVARTPDPSWPSLDKQGTFRSPTGGVRFGDVAMNWYMNQTGKSLVDTRGHLMDNVGLSVTDLDAWVAKLKAEKVTFLRQPFMIGDARAVMIQGPSHEAIELVEVK